MLIWSKTRQAILTTPRRQHLTVRRLALPNFQLRHTKRVLLLNNFFRQLLPPLHLLLRFQHQFGPLPWPTGRLLSWAPLLPFRQQSAPPKPC